MPGSDLELLPEGGGGLEFPSAPRCAKRAKIIGGSKGVPDGHRQNLVRYLSRDNLCWEFECRLNISIYPLGLGVLLIDLYREGTAFMQPLYLYLGRIMTVGPEMETLDGLGKRYCVLHISLPNMHLSYKGFHYSLPRSKAAAMQSTCFFPKSNWPNKNIYIVSCNTYCLILLSI